MKNVYTVMLLLLIFSLSSYALEWDVPIFVSDGNETFELRYGINPNGTDAFDDGLDQKAPPPPPSGNFDTRWVPVGSGTDDLFIDIRDNSIQEKTYEMSYQPQSGFGPIVLSWDPDLYAELGTFFIIDAITGTLFGPLDMTGQSSLDVSSTGGLTDDGLQILVTPFELTEPVAQFVGEPVWGQAPLTVNFTDQSAVGDEPNESWNWDFGDGNTSTEQNPEHTYTEDGTYTVTLTVADASGDSDSMTRTDYIVVDPVSSIEASSAVPSKFEVFQNYPNPFNPETQINFNLANAADVEVVVYNTLGQSVRTLVSGTIPAGNHSVTWDAKDENGNQMNSGVYYYTVRADENQSTYKMVLVK